jgi:regulator of protease activity HflC (stomatin/prohibitin superfamily)
VTPLIISAVIVVLVLAVLSRMVRIVPQARAGVVERLGRYSRTLTPGLTLLVPFVDRVRPLLDLREQVVTFPPQQVITKDNLVVGIDTVIYFQVTDPRAATYEIADYIQAIEQLSVTTLRNAVGNLLLEESLTSREHVNTLLGAVLDEATGKWGIKVNRVELKAIEPPASIRDSMEKSMRADRDKRAAILTAEGEKSAAILSAEGRKAAAVLSAEGDAQAAVLRAEGEAEAIRTVNQALHDAELDDRLLAYRYLDRLPAIAAGDANKVWFLPSDLSQVVSGLTSSLRGETAPAPAPESPSPVRAPRRRPTAPPV